MSGEIIVTASVTDDAIDIDRVDAAIERIERIEDETTARECIDDLDLLRSYLERLHIYEEKVREYAVLECEMWFKIADTVEAPTVDHFKKGEVALIKWIHGKSADERLEIIETCRRDGINVKGQKIAEDREHRTKRAGDSCLRLVAESVNEVMEKGMGVLSIDSVANRMIKSEYLSLGSAHVRSYVDMGRDELLKRGAVGLGDRKGTYIVPSMARGDKVAMAIDQRIRGAVADIDRITDLVREYDVKISPQAAGILQNSVTSLQRELLLMAERRMA